MDVGNGMDSQHSRLACQACQRKKIKCDRTFPCGQCTRSSLQCVQSTRKPRTRHAGKRAVDSELRNRISKLESLVETLSGDGAQAMDDRSPVSDADTVLEPQTSPSTVGNKYIGSPFWSSLTTEVQALRDALEDEEDDDESEPVSSPSTFPTGPGNSLEYDLILQPPGTIYIMPGALIEPSPEISSKLCNVFLDNVNRMMRVFHAPTLKGFMIHGNPMYLGYDASAPCNRAVKAAVWFSATNSLSDAQCHEMFGQPRKQQLAHFRRHVDVALAQADFLNTTGLANLQAFMTYVAASRLADASRRVWTLAALAVRIARAMGLHEENIARSPYETELRRRLWHQVRFLDIYTGMDRGTELLIDANSFDTPVPSNVNDDEFDESSSEIPNHTTGLTDMSLALMSHEAGNYTYRLSKPEDKPIGDTWQQRLELAEKFSRSVEEKYLRFCNPSNPFERMLRYIGSSMVNGMRLRAVRPVQKHVSSVLPPVHSPFVFKLATDSLRASERMHTDPEVQRWRWMVWVQWHALAISLAGLCFQRDNDVANEAWALVERQYERNQPHVADSRNGMLWRPIEKLYKKATAFRDHGAAAAQEVSPPELPRTPTLQYPSTGQSAYPTPAAFSSNHGPHPSAPNTNAADFLPAATSALALNHNGLPAGAMPTDSGIDMPFDFSNPLTSGAMELNNDITWMDFERILDDMSHPASSAGADIALPDINWPQQMPLPGEDWNTVMNQGMM